MDCNQARQLLPAHADRELTVTESIEVERHLNDCAACQAEYARQTALSSAVRQHAAYHSAPGHLQHRILAVLPRDGAATINRQGREKWRWPRWKLGTVSVRSSETGIVLKRQ